MKYKKITDKKEIDDLMRGYFFVISGTYFLEGLEYFGKKMGFGVEFVDFSFEGELDAYDLGDSEPIGPRRVMYSADKPAALENSEVFLSFEEFYAYLAEYSEKEIVKNPQNEDEIRRLLGEVKIALEV